MLQISVIDGWQGINSDCFSACRSKAHNNVHVESSGEQPRLSWAKIDSKQSSSDTEAGIRLPLSLHYLLFYNKADEESVTCLVTFNTLYLIPHYFVHIRVRFSLSRCSICTLFCTFFAPNFMQSPDLHF